MLVRLCSSKNLNANRILIFYLDMSFRGVNKYLFIKITLHNDFGILKKNSHIKKLVVFLNKIKFFRFDMLENTN